jgi:hypothetical protein
VREARLERAAGQSPSRLAGRSTTLYAMSKADQVAEQGGSIVPFWVAYAAGVAAAACWWVYYVLHPEAVRRSLATGPTRRSVIAMWLVIVGLVLVQAFAAVGLQAVFFGASAGFVLTTTLGCGAYVLRERRRSRT